MARTGEIIGLTYQTKMSATEEDQVKILRERGALRIVRFARDDFGYSLEMISGQLKQGDCIAVFDLSRLARRPNDLWPVVRKMEERGFNIISLNECIDTREDPSFFHFCRMMEAMRSKDLHDEPIKDRPSLAGRPQKVPDGIIADITASVAQGRTNLDDELKQLGISRATYFRRRAALKDDPAARG